MMTFRTATKTMERIDELAAENKMIRLGYYVALQDADFWQSHADPTHPYMAHFNSADMLANPTTFKNDADLTGGLQSGVGGGWDATTSETSTQITPTVTAPDALANSVWDSRPFRRVVWRNDYFSGGAPTFANPNVVDAASPLGWYRNHLQQNLVGGIYMRHAQDPDYKYILNWDFRPETTAAGSNGPGLESRENEFFNSVVRWYQDSGGGWRRTSYGDKFAFGNQNKRVANEKGWNPWHILGDYAQVSNCEGKRRLGSAVITDYGAAGAMPADLHELSKIADYRSGQLWYAQAMLGVYGMFDYTRRGEINQLQVSSVNLTQDAYLGTADDRLDRDFSKGEIPWSLNGGGSDMTYYREMAVLEGGGTRGTDDSRTAYPQSFADEYPLYNRLNYWMRIPTRYDARREQALIGARYAFLNDFDSYVGMQKTGMISIGGDGATDRFWDGRHPLALFYPRIAQRRRITLETYDWSLPNWDVIKPISLLFYGGQADEDLDRPQYKPVTRPDGYRFVKGNHWNVMESRHTSRTWHLPQSTTNDMSPDLQGQGLEGMAMGTSIYRYRYNGNEVARCKIILHKEGSSELRTINFNVFSTSLRGARQFWGRRSGSDGIDDGFGNKVKIGDWYQ